VKDLGSKVFQSSMHKSKDLELKVSQSSVHRSYSDKPSKPDHTVLDFQ